VSHYQAPRWLRGSHAQTIWPALLIRQTTPPYRRELWHTPDGGQIAVDRIDGQPGQPLVVLFHGLEGSSRSHYAIALMHEVARRGWHGAVPHFRGCGGVENRQPRAYHAGDAAEIAWICSRLAAENTQLFAAGVSLGGNMLLRYLGEQPDSALPLAAAAVSAPLDLAAASTRLDRGLGRVLYTRMFMNTLKPKSLRQLHYHPRLSYVRRVRQSGHGAAARLPRRTRLLGSRQQQAAVAAHHAANPGAECGERPVPATARPARPARGQPGRHAGTTCRRRARRFCQRPVSRHTGVVAAAFASILRIPSAPH